MGKRETTPAVNAGSMADIAFLLLIFFLVTTTIETDAGLDRVLPRLDGDPTEHHQRNIFTVVLNDRNRLLVNDAPIELADLKERAIAFIDNGGAGDMERYCDYCKGAKDRTSSDNPGMAVIVLKTQRETDYGHYIAVQNELVAAYNFLRNREADRLYGTKYTLMESMYRDPRTGNTKKEILAEKIKNVRSMFPLNISEAEIKNR